MTTLEQCVASIRENTKDYELIIADDSSSKAGIALAASIAADKTFLGTVGKQLGAAKNFNRALLAAEGDYLTVPPLSDDTEVLPGWADEAIRFLDDNPDVGWCAFAVFGRDWRLQNIGGFYGRPCLQPEPCLYAGKGIMRRDTLGRIGLFDERFKQMYWEDTDMGMRVNLLGLKVQGTLMAAVIHNHRGTQVCRPGKTNNLLFRRKWGLL